jgi:Spy/CpxP family protein refolding chaperone
MKTSYPILAAVAAATLLLSISSASAQDAARGRRGGGLPNATEEQTAALQQLNQDTREQNQKVTAARTELGNAIYAEKVDEAAIKAKVAALAKAEEELAVARAKGFSKIRSKFTSEQIDALKAMGGRGGAGAGARRRGAQ